MRALAVALALCLVALAFLLLRGERAVRAPSRTGTPPAGEPAAPAADGVAAQDAPEPPPRPEDAAELRRRLRTDEAALREARLALLDPATPRDRRMTLALVLGTLTGNDEALLDALRLFAADPELVRCLLLALGAAREPEDDDDVFDLGDRPWGEKAAGLGITVDRAIDDARVRAAVAAHLAAEDDAVRAAAAAALRHSLASGDARDAFLAQLGREASDDVATILGEALAGRAAHADERAGILDALLRRAGEEGFDGYRFRLEDDLARVPLGPPEQATLLELARSPRPFGVRAFALTVLAGAGGGAGAEARGLLETCLREDTDEAVRDLAARLLGNLPADDGSLAQLVRASAADTAWRVRYSAVEALAASGRSAAVLPALRAASADADERVATRAKELLRRLEAR